MKVNLISERKSKQSESELYIRYILKNFYNGFRL